MKRMALVLAIVMALAALTFAGCAKTNTDYMSWKLEDWEAAKDAEKTNCTIAYSKAIGEAQGLTSTDEEYAAAAPQLMSVLEASLKAYPENTVKEIVDMALALAQASEEPIASEEPVETEAPVEEKPTEAPAEGKSTETQVPSEDEPTEAPEQTEEAQD